MFWDVITWFNFAWSGILVAVSIGGRVWYWLDDNDDTYQNYIIYGIVQKINGGNKFATYDTEAATIVWLGLMCITFFAGVIIEALHENPLLVLAIFSIPVILFATRFVMRLKKRVDKI